MFKVQTFSCYNYHSASAKVREKQISRNSTTPTVFNKLSALQGVSVNLSRNMDDFLLPRLTGLDDDDINVAGLFSSVFSARLRLAPLSESDFTVWTHSDTKDTYASKPTISYFVKELLLHYKICI